MKTFFVAFSLVAMLLASGCASRHNGMVLTPVGPDASAPATVETTGTLLVYSSFEIGAHFYDPPNKRRHTDYKIYSADGTFLQRVHNDNETVMEGPVAVGLPPGNYRVVAKAAKDGEVTVPVIIAARQTTSVHLENGVEGKGVATVGR